MFLPVCELEIEVESGKKSQVKEDNKGYVAVALTNTEKYQPDLTLSSLISQWKLNTFLA